MLATDYDMNSQFYYTPIFTLCQQKYTFFFLILVMLYGECEGSSIFNLEVNKLLFMIAVYVKNQSQFY